MANKHDREPIKHTCPDIDWVIRRVNDAMKSAKDGMKMCDSDSDEWSCFDNIIDELYQVEGKLEQLRTSNDELRQWGIEEANKVDELEEILEASKL